MRTMPWDVGDESRWRDLWSTASRARNDSTLLGVPEPLSPAELAELSSRMTSAGYCSARRVFPPTLIAALLRLVTDVCAAGWPPAFAFLCDGPWQLFASEPIRAYAAATLGADSRRMADFFAFHVPASGSGFRPHREVAATGGVGEHGEPFFLTIWVPLSDATLDNGCIYVLPANLEPHRRSPADIQANYSDGQEGVLETHLHAAQAVPAEAGSFVSWNHEVMHWGSFARAEVRETRVSIACEFIRADVAPSTHPHLRILGELVDDAPTPADLVWPVEAVAPTFAQRQYLLAFQLIKYLICPDRDADPFHAWARATLLNGWPAG